MLKKKKKRKGKKEKKYIVKVCVCVCMPFMDVFFMIKLQRIKKNLIF